MFPPFIIILYIKCNYFTKNVLNYELCIFSENLDCDFLYCMLDFNFHTNKITNTNKNSIYHCITLHKFPLRNLDLLKFSGCKNNYFS